MSRDFRGRPIVASDYFPEGRASRTSVAVYLAMSARQRGARFREEGARPWEDRHHYLGDWQTYKRQRLHANISIIMATFVASLSRTLPARTLRRRRARIRPLRAAPAIPPRCIPSHLAARINYRFQMQKYE